MKTGDRVIRHSTFGVVEIAGPIRPTRSRENARKIVRMLKIFGKRARIVTNIKASGTVTR